MKRESGWYRVQFSEGAVYQFAEYVSDTRCWWCLISDSPLSDSDFFEIDPQMAMTPSGEIVYNQNQVNGFPSLKSCAPEYQSGQSVEVDDGSGWVSGYYVGKGSCGKHVVEVHLNCFVTGCVR